MISISSDTPFRRPPSSRLFGPKLGGDPNSTSLPEEKPAQRRLSRTLSGKKNNPPFRLAQIGRTKFCEKFYEKSKIKNNIEKAR